tara:strand:- start:71605 stop:72651 length:1047 start_codon:yes stop_codon:yes gene_type:complete
MSYQQLVNKISFESKGLDIVPNYKSGTILIIKNRLEVSNEVVRLLEKLNDKDIEIINLSNIEIKTINLPQIIEKIKSKKICKIFSIGGGTMIDFTKRIRVEIEDISKSRIEFYIIPSRVGSGAESSSTSIINTHSGKNIKVDDRYIPTGVIYYTKLYESLKLRDLSMGALDSITHCIESTLSINKNSYLDFLSIQTINYVFKVDLLDKLISNDKLLNIDFKNLSILSFNGGIAQNNAGSGICHALAHAAEAMTGLHHTKCITYFFSPIMNYYNLTNLDFKNLFDSKIIELTCKISQKMKSIEDLKLLDDIINDNDSFIRLINLAKEDLCWRLYKKKIDIDLLRIQLNK